MRLWSREEWGARPPKNTPNPIYGAKGLVVLHHTVTPQPGTPDDGAAWCREIQGWHMDGNGWNDIGYNFLVGAGNGYVGRGWGIVGAQCEGYNSQSHGIALLANGEQAPVSDADLRAVAALIREGLGNGWIDPAWSLVPHGDLNATACCGGYIRAQIPTIIEYVNGGGPMTPTEEAVRAAYLKWAFREPDAGGLAYWSAQIDSGACTLEYVIQSLVNAEGWDRLAQAAGLR